RAGLPRTWRASARRDPARTEPPSTRRFLAPPESVGASAWKYDVVGRVVVLHVDGAARPVHAWPTRGPSGPTDRVVLALKRCDRVPCALRKRVSARPRGGYPGSGPEISPERLS